MSFSSSIYSCIRASRVREFFELNTGFEANRDVSVGKSSLILMNQAKWRCSYPLFFYLTGFPLKSEILAHGLWGHAKFETTSLAPFAAIVRVIHNVSRIYTDYDLTSYRASPLCCGNLWCSQQICNALLRT